MERNNMPIQEIQYGTKKIFLLGTAHISEESIQDVMYAIETIKPSSVAVELDPAREKRILKKDQQWQELNLFKVIKQKRTWFLLSNIVLSSFQRRLGEHLSVTPGQEMLTAITESKKHNIPITLADRSAEVTLKRAWSRASFWERQKIIASLVSILFSKQTVSEEELTELKQKINTRTNDGRDCWFLASVKNCPT